VLAAPEHDQDRNDENEDYRCEQVVRHSGLAFTLAAYP
jgi:hypothetical protein